MLPTRSTSAKRSSIIFIRPGPSARTRSTSWSRSTMRWTARPAAHASVWPVNVCPVCGPPTASQHGRDLVVVERRAERHVPAAEALGDRHHVGHDAVVFERPPCATSPGAAHHLVGDHQNAMAVADLAHHPCVPGRSGDRAAGGADDGLEHEARDVLLAETDDLALQLIGARGGDIVGGHAERWAVRVDRRQMRRGDERALVRSAPLLEVRHRQRAECVAVPRAFAGDEALTGRCAGGVVVVEGDLQRRFDGLGSTGGEDHLVDPGTAAAGDELGQLVHRIAGEVVAVGVGDGVELALDGVVDLGMGVAEAVHRRPTRAVDVLLARHVVEPAPAPVGDLRQHHRLAIRRAPHGQLLMRSLVGSYNGAEEARAGYSRPLISTVHVPASRYERVTGSPASTIARPTAPPSV